MRTQSLGQVRNRLIFAAGIVAALLLAGACGDANTAGGSSTGPAASTFTSPVTTTRQEGSSKDITRERFGDQWPLTVDHAILGCTFINGGAAYDLTVNVNGDLYALNGTARGHAASSGYKDIHEIWSGGQDMSPLLAAALQLCK